MVNYLSIDLSFPDEVEKKIMESGTKKPPKHQQDS